MLEKLDVPPDTPLEEIEAQARDLLARVRNPEALIFTDVFGATPCNVAQRLASSVEGAQVKVIAAVNVRCCGAPCATRTNPRHAGGPCDGRREGGHGGDPHVPQNQAYKPGANDQDHHHHQQ